MRSFDPSICKQPTCERCGKLDTYLAVTESVARQTGQRTADPGNGGY